MTVFLLGESGCNIDRRGARRKLEKELADEAHATWQRDAQDQRSTQPSSANASSKGSPYQRTQGWATP